MYVHGSCSNKRNYVIYTFILNLHCLMQFQYYATRKGIYWCTNQCCTSTGIVASWYIVLVHDDGDRMNLLLTLHTSMQYI